MELTKENIQNLRQDYRTAQLSESDVATDPILQFKKWFSEALEAKLYEPNVMTLATADSEGKPSARIVLLKDFDENGFVFYTNYESKKGQDLVENPQAALVFFWAELERQVRIEGLVTKVDPETSTAYFHPYIFSYCSPQKPGKKSEKHEVELRIATSQWHGSVEHEFSTKGFTRESCDAAAKPEFRTSSTKEPAAAAKGDGDDTRPKKKKKPKPDDEEEAGPES